MGRPPQPRRRAGRALGRLLGRSFDRTAVIDHWAPGASFADVGAMWTVEGAVAFRAASAGARRVTAVDLMPATERFVARAAASTPEVTFVQGDVNDPEVRRRVGVHDVVWCSGVLYHAPDPVLMLRNLRSLTGRVLLLGSEVVRERRPTRSVVFGPGPDVHPNAPARFDPATGYNAWWWGFSPSALRALCESAGFDVRAEHGTRTFRLLEAHPR